MIPGMTRQQVIRVAAAALSAGLILAPLAGCSQNQNQNQDQNQNQNQDQNQNQNQDQNQN